MLGFMSRECYQHLGGDMALLDFNTGRLIECRRFMAYFSRRMRSGDGSTYSF